MCNCEVDITKRLLNAFQMECPSGTEHKAQLEGYALVFGKGLSITSKGFMPVTKTAYFPLKNGGLKKKKIKQNMIFTYCPFCGVKYETTN